MKSGNQTDLQIANNFLCASTQPILAWARACRMYGEHKFKDKKLAIKVKALRESFYHEGSKKEIENFWQKHKELKRYINANA